MIKFISAFVCLICSLLSTSAAYAWDDNVIGTTWQVHITDATNYGFRIYLSGGLALCGNSYNWAYLNATDSNYNTYVAVMLMAKAQGQSIQLYTNRDVNGVCHIGYVVLL